MLQGDAGAGRASDDSCHWLFKAKFPLQAPVGRILAQVASGTSLCYTFQKSLELGWLIVAALNSKTVEEGLYFDLVPLLNLKFHCRRTLQTSHRHILEQLGEVAEVATGAEVVILEDFFYLACILAHNLLQASWQHLVSLHHLHELSEGQWLNDQQPGHVELLLDFVCYEGHADLNDELAKRYIIGKTPRKSPHCGSDGVALVVAELIRAVWWWVAGKRPQAHVCKPYTAHWESHWVSSTAKSPAMVCPCQVAAARWREALKAAEIRLVSDRLPWAESIYLSTSLSSRVWRMPLSACLTCLFLETQWLPKRQFPSAGIRTSLCWCNP